MLDAAEPDRSGAGRARAKAGRRTSPRRTSQTLLVDYTRLFLGPPQPLARPHGSFWLTGETTLMQDATMAVLDLYQEGGFELDDEFREVPDHVAVELEFLYLLIFKRNEAQRAGLARRPRLLGAA